MISAALAVPAAHFVVPHLHRAYRLGQLTSVDSAKRQRGLAYVARYANEDPRIVHGAVGIVIHTRSVYWSLRDPDRPLSLEATEVIRVKTNSASSPRPNPYVPCGSGLVSLRINLAWGTSSPSIRECVVELPT